MTPNSRGSRRSNSMSTSPPKSSEVWKRQKRRYMLQVLRPMKVFRWSVQRKHLRSLSACFQMSWFFASDCYESIAFIPDIPGVVFVLPDSYIDPVNKEYGGDKYVNEEIFPRPPPVHCCRRNNRDRRPRDQMPYQQGNTPYSNQGPSNSEARNYGQSYGPPPHQQNYGPPPQQQGYGPPPQQAMCLHRSSKTMGLHPTSRAMGVHPSRAMHLHCSSKTIGSRQIFHISKIILHQDLRKQEGLPQEVMHWEVVKEIHCLLIRET